jgi:hypothetical protein
MILVIGEFLFEFWEGFLVSQDLAVVRGRGWTERTIPRRLTDSRRRGGVGLQPSVRAKLRPAHRPAQLEHRRVRDRHWPEPQHPTWCRAGCASGWRAGWGAGFRSLGQCGWGASPVGLARVAGGGARLGPTNPVPLPTWACCVSPSHGAAAPRCAAGGRRAGDWPQAPPAAPPA